MAFLDVYWQVVHAIMSVTPWARISEEVLRKAILEMYTSNSLIPTGISIEAMGNWCEKMAFGIHKVVRRFRKLYTESPTSSKSAKMQALKDRCMKSGVPVLKPQDSSDSLGSTTPRSASATDLEKVSPPPVDLAKILQRLRQKRIDLAESNAESVEEAAPEVASKAPASDETVRTRPVATPARALPKEAAVANKWLLPNYVLQQLQKKEEYVPPFDTQGADDGEDVGAIDAELAAPKKKGKTKEKRKQQNRRKPKKKKTETFAAEDEAALTQEAAGMPAAQAAEAEVNAPAGPAAEQAESTKRYVPGEFGEARKKLIKAARAEQGIKHAAANELWMASDLRASYLSEMSPSEMKKRRFM